MREEENSLTQRRRDAEEEEGTGSGEQETEDPKTRRPEHLTPRYRFGFVLTTAAGNMNRYLNLRKYAERDPEVECVWAPISHFLEPDPYRKLPMPLRVRLIVRDQGRPVMSQWRRLDAIMYHAFEPFVQGVIRRTRSSRPLVVWSNDNPPVSDLRGHPQLYYGGDQARSNRRLALRFRFDVWCLRHADLCFPHSEWAAEILRRDCGVPDNRILAGHPGIDLEQWPHCPPKAPVGASRPQILFVGGEFKRKGGDLLLDVHQKHFADRADLHLVTKFPLPDVPPHVTVHTGLGPNDPRLRQLYANCDVFVLPTRADMSPWAILEAMATGRPVISTAIGGIPDLIEDGKTGYLLERDDANGLMNRLQTLLADAEKRRGMGEAGRRLVEQSFDAAVTVPRLLARMKSAVVAS